MEEIIGKEKLKDLACIQFDKLRRHVNQTIFYNEFIEDINEAEEIFSDIMNSSDFTRDIVTNSLNGKLMFPLKEEDFKEVPYDKDRKYTNLAPYIYINKGKLIDQDRFKFVSNNFENIMYESIVYDILDKAYPIKMPYTPKQYLVIQENHTIDGTYYWRIRYVIDLKTYTLYKHNDYFANSSPISKELYNKKVKDI